MLLWVLGLFGKSLESSRDFSMRCQRLMSSFLRQYVGKCSVYVVVNASIYGLLSVSSLLHILNMLLCIGIGPEM